MQINNSDFQSFKGFYRFPNKGNNLKSLQNYISPTYQKIKHEPLYFFVGNNPYNIGLKQAIGDATSISGYGEEWVKANAARHGIDLSVFGENNIFIVSGKKHIEEFVKYSKKKKDRITSTWHKIKTLFRITKRYFQRTDIPKHLKYLDFAAEQNKIENRDFAEFLNGRAQNIDDPYELIRKMLTE